MVDMMSECDHHRMEELTGLVNRTYMGLIVLEEVTIIVTFITNLEASKFTIYVYGA